MKKRHGRGFGVCLAIGMLFMVSVTAGCSLGEALVDGVLQGISDTVAEFVSQL